MSPLMGLDVGDVRVGISLSDTERRLAVPVETVNRARDQALARILELIEERAVTTIVVGLPLSQDGARNEQCEKIERFCRRLSRRTKAQITYIDEHLTSAEAEHKLRSAGTSKENLARKMGITDAVAASIILQTFIDSRT